MKFSTKIPIANSNAPIDYNSKIVSLGSCFAENISDKFTYYKFQNNVNPFGIIFNPVAIENLILKIVSKTYFTSEDIFFYNESWHCFDVHSDWSNTNATNLLADLNARIEFANQQILNSTHIIITYGTSWVYRNRESNAIVANCHKLPQKHFEKELLSVETIQKSIRNTITLIEKVNPNCTFIFTVSPVRHIKDGFVENQWSKANLISALNFVLQQSNAISSLGVKLLFPSYEIMMDELRDYRFYTQDMLHPNQVAIDYIWERFTETFISESIYPIMDEVASIQKGIAHRAFNPDSESHLKFESRLKTQIQKLVLQFSYMEF